MKKVYAHMWVSHRKCPNENYTYQRQMQVLWKKIKISPEVKYISLHHNSQTLQQM